MSEKRSERRARSLMEALGLVAVYITRKLLQVGWKHATGKEAPAGPDDQDVSLGRAVIWTLLLGALATTARMIAIRYAAILFPRGWRQRLEGQAPPDQAEGPDDLRIAA
jgi:Protein of unknown function (DUF4235)